MVQQFHLLYPDEKVRLHQLHHLTAQVGTYLLQHASKPGSGFTGNGFTVQPAGEKDAGRNNSSKPKAGSPNHF